MVSRCRSKRSDDVSVSMYVDKKSPRTVVRVEVVEL